MTEIVTNLAAAWAAGGLIGLERSHNGRAAGFRTLSIVSIAAAASMVLTFEPQLVPAALLGQARLDPGRIAQGVMTGVGFLGAGVIFKEGVSVQGLTTAAAIWATSAIGLLMGLGMIWPGALVTGAVLATLILFRWIEHVMPERTYALLVLRFHAGVAPSEAALIEDLRRIDVTLSGLSYALRQDGDVYEVRGMLQTGVRHGLSGAAAHFRDTPGLVEFTLDRISK
ncbi:MgtC/SapB family protein [Caulobacter sp. KR2-114]|uniref:MgtC/SapB family protein n=1 Tax=Caulobacter sp. KR2-114 TaxID=3400912 RepID=UPI003C0485EF